MMGQIKVSVLRKWSFILPVLLPLTSLANVKAINIVRVMDKNQRIAFIDNHACRYFGEFKEISPGNWVVIANLKQCVNKIENVKMTAIPVNKQPLPIRDGAIWTLTDY